MTDDQERQVASEIEQSRPSWLVMWGCYSRLFWGFPRFSVPRGTIVSASKPDRLLADMDSVEAEQTAAPREPVYAAPSAASALPRRHTWPGQTASPPGAPPGMLWTSQAVQPPAGSYEPRVPDGGNLEADAYDPEPRQADRSDLDPYDDDEDPYAFYGYDNDDPYASSPA
jgi:hypothetical protein